jgi:subtilisin family serine protease
MMDFLPINSEPVVGALTTADPYAPGWDGAYGDLYQLSGVTSGQSVAISLNSNDFDAWLEVFETSTGEVIAADDDAGGAPNAQLQFTPQLGESYVVSATTYNPGETGNYTLSATSIDSFDSNYGYGLVDAAAAVASATGQTSLFPEMSDFGGTDWGLDMVNAPEVWNQGYTGEGITVAVLDSSVDYTHTDLDGNIWSNSDEVFGNGIDDDSNGYVDDVLGWDFVDGDNDPMDLDGHGTHVAGTIAAENDGFSATGVAYNTTIMPVRVTGALQDLDAMLADGIDYAVANGADILSMSLGNFPGDPLMPLTQAALDIAREAGVVAVMASGNERLSHNATRPIEPASYAGNDLGIAVGAVDFNERLGDFSNPAGSTPLDFVVAPGIEVFSTTPNNTYDYKNGTSMATPHVSGVAALVLSANPYLTPAEVESIITGTANPTGVTV